MNEEELKNLIVSNEGKKYVTKMIKRSFQQKHINKETRDNLLKELENREPIKNDKEKEARAKVRKHAEDLKTAENVSYDIDIKGFEPNLDFNSFLDHFNAKYFGLEPFLENPTILLNKENLKKLKIQLAEDHMFSEESIKVIKQYASIINEIGAVLPEEVEQEMTENDLEEFYSKTMKFYLYIHLYYKFFWIDNIESKGIKAPHEMSYIKLSKELLPDFVRKEESLFGMYIQKYLYPHFVIPAATEKGNKIFEAARHGEINSKSLFALGLKNTKQKELDSEYIIQKVKEVINLKF